jgi:hypothetical protein
LAAAASAGHERIRFSRQTLRLPASSVFYAMLGARNDIEILGTVVGLDAVLMVGNLARTETTPEHLLGD